jgi:RNA polymerase sigma factor (sigma-70 family)
MRLPPFQLLVDEHGDVVLRYLRAAVGRQEAEDCWQETMLSALRAYPALRDARNLRGWLLRIAHNTAIDLHRAAARRALPMAEPPEQAVEDTATPEPELWQAVRRLPGKQRAAVTLRFAGDLDYRAIGTMIDCSEAAARQNVRSGLAAVRREWGHARASS